MSTAWIDFDEVKRKVSMRDVLTVFGLADQFQQRGQTWVGPCPLPNHRHGPRPNHEQFKISHKDGIDQWYDFGDCKCGGSVIDFVQKMTGYSLAHTRLWFLEHFGARLATQKGSEPHERTEPPKEKAHSETGWTSETPQAKRVNATVPVSDESVKQLKPLRFRLLLDPSVPYLRERGLTEDTIRYFGCGLAKKGVLTGYVCFPIYRWPRQEPNENPLGYCGRLPSENFDNEHPRYKIPEGFRVSQCVHGLAEAMETTPAGTPLVVVEGVFKTAWMYQHGVRSAVSTLTSNVSDVQADLLVATGRPIVLCFDGNEDAYEAMVRSAGRLYDRTFVRTVRLPNGREPDDLSANEIRDLLPFLF